MTPADLDAIAADAARNADRHAAATVDAVARAMGSPRRRRVRALVRRLRGGHA